MVVQFDPVSRNHVKYTPMAIYAKFTEDSGEYEVPHFEDSWQQLLPNINHIVLKRRD